ncbi:hypothetical protein NDU88_002226 [Pleurodeles waltl]|uniref:Uncharacterized protein n=1 Tax=Pleurodeles waltl TaxID=8319 RepID=A0AAV7T2S1_PLEWA|nr:hypothetical protein NDU88_002226 [Pleurodeles waltl]
MDLRRAHTGGDSPLRADPGGLVFCIGKPGGHKLRSSLQFHLCSSGLHEDTPSAGSMGGCDRIFCGPRRLSSSAPAHRASPTRSPCQSGPRGNRRGRAPPSPSSGRLSPDQQAHVSKQTGAAVPPGRHPRAGAQGRLRSPGAFFFGRGRANSPAHGACTQSTGLVSSGSLAASPARRGRARRSRQTSLRAAESAEPRPPFCHSGRSGRSEGTGPEIFSRSPRQVPQVSEGHEDV